MGRIADEVHTSSAEAVRHLCIHSPRVGGMEFPIEPTLAELGTSAGSNDTLEGIPGEVLRGLVRGVVRELEVPDTCRHGRPVSHRHIDT